MADIEKLHFKIGLAGTYWEKHPIYSISVNDKLIETREVVAPSEETFYVEFDADVEEGPATLKIRLENKTDDDVVKDDDTREDYTIVKDMRLNIRSAEIDEIDLGMMIYTKTEFVGDDASRPVLDKCVNFGWNGTWTFTFESPFYIWLLENI